jgi:glutamyl-tRNA synthetase
MNKKPIRIDVSSIVPDEYIEVDDMIKGIVRVQTKEMDDLIILRSDETPVYMLSVVVDDHDMNITHIIRGDDHFTNTFRQSVIYRACCWSIPSFGHLPLIYGSDGKKLSKRYHAVGTDDYKEMGYLSEGLKIYLATMGYNTDKGKLTDNTFDELVSTFDISKISKSPTQFDINFLNVINQHLLKLPTEYNMSQLVPFYNVN